MKVILADDEITILSKCLSNKNKQNKFNNIQKNFKLKFSLNFRVNLSVMFITPLLNWIYGISTLVGLFYTENQYNNYDLQLYTMQKYILKIEINKLRLHILEILHI